MIYVVLRPSCRARALVAFVSFGLLLVMATRVVRVHAAAPEVVLYTASAPVVKGNWSPAAVSDAAEGRAMRSVNQGWSSVNAPQGTPAHYFEMTFDAPAGTPYRVWVRLRGASNSKWNESVWLQWSDALVGGRPAYRIGSTDGLLVNLERCSGCGLSGWGWQDGAYWLSQATTMTFASTGRHTLRVQTREDGVEVDQIVLSPARYLSSPPGPLTNDATIVPQPAAPASGSSAYGGTPVPVPGTLDAVRFDDGGAGVAYHDSSGGNAGGAFRATDVDIEPSSDGGYNVGWSAPGEWLAYSVEVAAPGEYTAELRVASRGGGALQVAFEAPSNVARGVAVPDTGGWQAWTTVRVPLTLAGGPQRLIVRFESLNVNLRSIAVSGGASPPAPSPSPTDPAGRVISVSAGGNVQAALDAAVPGDTILLQAGATYVGNFVLPRKSGGSTAYITIRTSAPDSVLPGPTTRITPASASHLPKLRSPNTAPVLATAAGAHHYRLQFLELQANANGAGTILALGDGSSAQQRLDQVPHDLIVDRVYVHGDPSKGQKRGIALNSAATTVVNSYISDIKAAGVDSQAICGWNGPGPFVIDNNYLEAAGENVLFGGADPSIPQLVPADIRISRNHVSKPLAWRSQHWTVKNLLELKSAERVQIDGNLFEHNWQAAQSGYAIVLKSVNQDGGAPWSVVQEVAFTNNVVRNVAAGMSISRHSSYPAVEINRITVRNNVFDRISRASYGGSGAFLLVMGGSAITVDHNTIFNDGASVLVPDAYPSPYFVFTNNILVDRAYAIKGAGATPGNGTIAKYFPSSEFAGGIYVGADPARYPAANYYPAALADVGFVDVGGGDYRLGPSSIYRGGATDGADPGADIDRLAAAQR